MTKQKPSGEGFMAQGSESPQSLDPMCLEDCDKKELFVGTSMMGSWWQNPSKDLPSVTCFLWSGLNLLNCPEPPKIAPPTGA